MRHFVKSIFVLGVILLNTLSYSFADRGVRSKSRKNITLNISTELSFNNSLDVNLKSGMKYRGLAFAETASSCCYVQGMAIKSYQKGNTIYLVPSTQKMIVPEINQGYTGMKLIIKPLN